MASHQMKALVLKRFDRADADLIGEGGESWVYSLDEFSVLRIHKAFRPEYANELKRFYEELSQLRLPFVVPQILSDGIQEGTYFTVEHRIAGTSFAQVLPKLSGQRRLQALKNYLNAAEEIHRIAIERPWSGELLAQPPVRRDLWSSFLWDRAAQTLVQSRRVLERDVPDLDHVLERFRKQLEPVTTSRRQLVHGDYFPGNVMIGEDLKVTGIIDFSPMTVAGDPMMDAAGAVLFLEPQTYFRPDDVRFLARLLMERHGKGFLETLALYRLYYSLYFSACSSDDPSLYRWCVDNLRSGGTGAALSRAGEGLL